MIQMQGAGPAVIAAGLRRAERELPGETERELRAVVPRLVNRARHNAEEILPRRGGYGRQVATQTRFRVEQIRMSGGVALRLVAVGPDYRIDRQGRLRHPVYARGPRSKWNWADGTQRVPSHWFTDPMLDDGHLIRGAVMRAFERTVHRR